MNEKKPLVSIIIRTKNEERWITQCLNAVVSQKYENFEVVIVDNGSSDKTVEKAEQFKAQLGERLKILPPYPYKEYLPGKALNYGIKASKGELIACLSGHCIPTNSDWLGSLVRNFDEPGVAGVYGRQEPMGFTSDADKRDLALIFGLDRRIQKKDSFFHNANSMIRRGIWNDMPFDEAVTNIEDRVWAQRLHEKKVGYSVIYDPEASVFHFHGIHQNGNEERCANVVRILEGLHRGYNYKSIEIEKLNIVAIIPVKGDIKYLDRKPLIAYTIQRALESKYIKRVIVSTDNAELACLAKELKAEAPFMRDASLSGASVNIEKVYQYSLEKIEEAKIFPDLVVSLEVTFPFRPKGLIDDMIEELAAKGLDSIIGARQENKAIWKEKDGEIAQMEEGVTPRALKEPTFIELRGVACVTHPEFLRGGHLLGKKLGMYEINNPYSHLEVRSEEDFKLASHLVKGLF